MSQRVLVLAPHLPFEVGGAEMLAETLRDEIARRQMLHRRANSLDMARSLMAERHRLGNADGA